MPKHSNTRTTSDPRNHFRALDNPHGKHSIWHVMGVQQMFVDWLNERLHSIVYWNVLIVPLCYEEVYIALKGAHVRGEATLKLKGSGPFKVLDCVVIHLNVILLLRSFKNFLKIISLITNPPDKKECKKKAYASYNICTTAEELTHNQFTLISYPGPCDFWYSKIDSAEIKDKKEQKPVF